MERRNVPRPVPVHRGYTQLLSDGSRMVLCALCGWYEVGPNEGRERRRLEAHLDEEHVDQVLLVGVRGVHGEPLAETAGEQLVH